jgi:hypothetical protein
MGLVKNGSYSILRFSLNGSSGSSSNNILPQDLVDRIRAMGLDVDAVKAHQKNIHSLLSSAQGRFFKIIDSCRFDNGGICPLPSSEYRANADIGIVAFVPAAGASSRYLLPLQPLMDALRSANTPAINQIVRELIKQKILSCPLPRAFHQLVEIVDANAGSIPEALAADLLREMESPKALYPAVLDGLTFFETKLLEHQAVGDFAGEIYVCPPGRQNDLLRVSSSLMTSSDVKCYEQGAALATVRFDHEGKIALDAEGQPSSVPAGHGSLANLLPDVKIDFPEARGVFIRNIDNVSGTSGEVVEATRKFLNVFRKTLELIDGIRGALKSTDTAFAESRALELLNLWSIKVTDPKNALKAVLESLFHSSGAYATDISAWNRPLVIMGQVPNTQKDVGGTCVFAEVDGATQKLCLEVPHASADDRQKFLEDPRLATHFNPVFVAAEIPNKATLASWEGHPFWLIAKKSWRGRDVFYQESILYELLGSSRHCNVIFTEVPRFLFNPHKTIFDAASRTSQFWSLEKPANHHHKG